MSGRGRGSPRAGQPPWADATNAAAAAALPPPLPASTAAHATDTPPRPPPPPPTSVRRVGGGYEYARGERYTEAAAAQAAYDTYRALPPGGGPHTATDVAVLAHILRAAEAELDGSGSTTAGQAQVRRCAPVPRLCPAACQRWPLAPPPRNDPRGPPPALSPAGHPVPGAARVPARPGGGGA